MAKQKVSELHNYTTFCKSELTSDIYVLKKSTYTYNQLQIYKFYFYVNTNPFNSDICIHFNTHFTLKNFIESRFL